MSDAVEAKLVSDSAIEEQTSLIFPNDLNSRGTLFGGRVLELADRLAAVVAMRHSGRVCVTLAIDSVRFLAPATQTDLLVMSAAVNRVWRSSMEIGLKAYAEHMTDHQRRHIFSAYFTYVALDERQKTVAVPAILPKTDEQKRRYEDAQFRRHLRLASLPCR